ncbi:MAG: cyclic nucleotide-binding domain-containing protein [Proteobacteria bacterium]|nr:cyclic nucleotide-binding domain-containing protein [Pseudomonadota bacterium]
MDQILRKVLKLVHLFEGFSERDARDFIAWSVRFDAAPDESVIREGEHGQDMFVVVAGNLRVVKEGAGAERELAVLEPGDSFGEIALLDSGPRSASVVAITASTLLRFERKNLVKIPEVSLKLYRNIATMVAARLRDTSARVILAKSPMPESVSDEDHSSPPPARSISRMG